MNGIIRNNPGNVRLGTTQWVGMAADQEGPFIVFDDYKAPQDGIYGIRCMARILETYIARGTNTIETMIATWAPSSENNVPAYVSDVCTRTSMQPSQRVAVTDLLTLIPAIIWHEQGEMPYSAAAIATGIALA